MNPAELFCLALTVYFEARDQELRGQVAVAHVVLNRVEDSRWPDTVCEVVKDGGEEKHRCQFSFYCDGVAERIHDRRAWRTARVVASTVAGKVLDDVTGGATLYYATSRPAPYWTSAQNVRWTATIGGHAFFKEGPRR